MEPKFFLNSATVRGIILTILPTLSLILGIFGVSIGEGEKKVLIDGIVGAVGVVGVIYAIIGRMRVGGGLKFTK